MNRYTTLGSIPAHTGEPHPPRSGQAANRVYPRTHGGTRPHRARRPGPAGLSPHTRGNPSSMAAAAIRTGSIPAHTGEPCAGASSTAPRRVYPRTHGGTLMRRAEELADAGLSPHTRGNLPVIGRARFAAGSIPAHTGEPPCARAISMRMRVYPRTHGGTQGAKRSRRPGRGLSPHTRGNLVLGVAAVAFVGSIPAHTGEPP